MKKPDSQVFFNMKVALVHDYIKEYGGAERVLEILHEMYPEAVLYTSIYCPKYLGPHKSRFDNWKIKTSFLQYIPFKEKLISPFRLISPFFFKSLDFSEYDVVIVSATGAYLPNLIKKGGAKHVCYCHTPPRYLYGYKTARDWKKNRLFKIVSGMINHPMRLLDFRSAQNVDLFIANSNEVKARIWKFYRKDAVIVYPPVETKGFKIHNLRFKNGNYFLAGGRLARAKRIDLAIKACNKLNLKLKIFGKSFAGYANELKKIAGSNIEFVGEVDDNEKFNLMAGAKAYIFPSDTEDFGITPVEAMSTGTPVIAYGAGGVLETVVDEKTGVFFKKLDTDSLVEAIKHFEDIKWNKEYIVKRSQLFSKRIFKNNINEIISNMDKKKGT